MCGPLWNILNAQYNTRLLKTAKDTAKADRGLVKKARSSVRTESGLAGKDRLVLKSDIVQVKPMMASQVFNLMLTVIQIC